MDLDNFCEDHILLEV